MNANNLSNVWFKVTDLEVASGEGSWVTTTSRRASTSTSAAASRSPRTGHAHPHVAEAIADQARAVHPRPGQRATRHDLLEPLAARLAELTPGRHRHVLLRQLGRRDHRGRGEARQAGDRAAATSSCSRAASTAARIMAMAMTTSKTGYRAGHAPLPSGVFVAPFPTRSRPTTDGRPRSSAALAGVRPPAHDADRAERDRGRDHRAGARRGRLHAGAGRRSSRRSSSGASEHGILFIADEVQSGFGRTGKMFAVEHYGVEPDIMCMAKGIASGLPVLGARHAPRARRPVADRLARRHLRRQPDRLRGRARHDRRAHRRRVPRQRERARRATRRRAAARCRPATRGWSVCGRWA